jgi:hypothetical protein
MAKSARTAPEVNDRVALQHLNEIMSHFEAIDEARSRFSTASARERAGMGALYEALAQLGVPQATAKLNIKIARAMQKIRGWLAQLEEGERKMAQRLAKLQKDRAQLTLFTELVPNGVAEAAEPVAVKEKKRGRGRPRKANVASEESVAEAA